MAEDKGGKVSDIEERKFELEERKLKLEERKLKLQVRLFEVDQLRKEILQHDALATQAANWTSAGALACAGYAWSQPPAMQAYSYALALVGVLVAWVGLLNNLARAQANVYIGSYIAKNLEPDTGLDWEGHLRRERVKLKRGIWENPRAFAVTLFYIGSVVHACVWTSRLGHSIIHVVLIGSLALVIPWVWNLQRSAKHVGDAKTISKEDKARAPRALPSSTGIVLQEAATAKKEEAEAHTADKVS
jgi:hypothetical protein